MTTPTQSDAASHATALAPTGGLLTRALTSLRTYAGEAAHRDALRGLCVFAIHHAVETLRRSGQYDEARKILIGELGDLALAQHGAQHGAPQLERLAANTGGLKLVSSRVVASRAQPAPALVGDQSS